MLIVFAVFLGTRYMVLFQLPVIERAIVQVFGFPPAERASDVHTYADKAFTYHYAAMLGKSYYVHHAELIQRQRDIAQRMGREGPPPWRDIIEYPPPAVLWLALPQYINDPLPAPEVAGRMNPVERETLFARLTEQYIDIYRNLTAIPDALAFLLCAVVVVIVFRGDSALVAAGRMMLYVLLGGVLCQILYDRLDLLCGLLVVAAIALMVMRVPFFLSFAVLGLAINFKLVPIVLVPLWMLGSLRVDDVPPKWSGPVLGRIAVVLASRLAMILGFAALWMAPFVMTQGWKCLDFLTYQQDRGIHLESMYAAIMLMLRPFGHESGIIFDHESFGLDSSLAGAFGAVSSPIMFVGVLAATFLFVRPWLRRSNGETESGAESSRGPKPAARGGETLAQRCPDAFIATAVLALMVTLCGSKLFSPQFLLWFVPLVPLVRLRGFAAWAVPIGFVAVCGISTAMFPFLFKSDILAMTGPPTQFTGPTTLGAGLIISRNLLFLAIACVLAWHLLRNHGDRTAPAHA